MAMGPLKRKRTVIGRVMVSKWAWSMAMGPLRRKRTLAGRVRVSKWGWSMAMGPSKRKKFVWLGGSGWLSGDGRGPWGP